MRDRPFQLQYRARRRRCGVQALRLSPLCERRACAIVVRPSPPTKPSHHRRRITVIRAGPPRMMADSITFIRYWNNASFLNNSGRWWTIADRWRGWAAPCFFVKNAKNTMSCAARPALLRPRPSPHTQQQKNRRAVKRAGFFKCNRVRIRKPPPAARGCANCAGRTGPGLRQPKPSPAGTAWRSGRQVPGVRRSGSVPGRR